MGIPEEHLEAVSDRFQQQASSELQEMADIFSAPSTGSKANLVSRLNPSYWTSRRRMATTSRQRSLSGIFPRSREELLHDSGRAARRGLSQRASTTLSMSSDHDDDLVQKLSNFLRKTHDFFEKVAKRTISLPKSNAGATARSWSRSRSSRTATSPTSFAHNVQQSGNTRGPIRARPQCRRPSTLTSKTRFRETDSKRRLSPTTR